MAPTITHISTDTAVLDLPEPLALGDMVVTRREYGAVAIHLSNGIVGKAYCLTREAPMVDIINRMFAPRLLGSTVEDLPEMWQSLHRHTAIVGRVGLVRRALGLVDIALWDAASQCDGAPLGVFLDKQFPGVVPQRLPSSPSIHQHALLVAAYPTKTRTARSVANEVIAHSQDGWRLFKVSRSPNHKLMAELLNILRHELPAGCEVVVDVGFGWRDAPEGISELQQWGDAPVAWVEDPLLPEDVDGIAAIRRETGRAIGVGDEVTDPNLFKRLVDAEALDVIRLDVVALGGITPSLDLLSFAAKNQLPVSAHIYPEVTAHLGIGVETFPRYAGPYDPAPSFILGGPTFDRGIPTPPTTPGLGFNLDPRVFTLGKDTT